MGKVTSRSIGFSWSEVPEDDRNGIVRTYTIKFWLTDDPRFGGVYKRASRSIKFVHLRTYSNHSIVVLATTIKAGNYSEPVTVLTSEAGEKKMRFPIYSIMMSVEVFGGKQTEHRLL